jgi:hypothetical protein
MMSASGAITMGSTTKIYPKKKHSKDIFINLASGNVEKLFRLRSRLGKNVSRPRGCICTKTGFKSYITA